MLKSNISLVKKNDSWLPKKEQQLSAIEKHGYTLLKTLGEGAYAKVKLADSKKHNTKVAVKVINKRRAPKDFLQKFLPREVHLMHRLNHPNVIRLFEVVETSTKVYLVLQLASGGDLLEYINNRPMLTEKEVRVLFCQLAAAMMYCHKENVVHRDLKCENILIAGDGKLKVTDFGFAVSTFKNRLLETYCGSFAYCCPEILRGRPYDGKKADVWSMGVVLYAMGCARLPFSEDDIKCLVKDDYNSKIKFSKRVSKEYRNLVRWMLEVNQNERATAEEVFKSPWCRQAIEDNPELSYLVEAPQAIPVRVRKPSECVLQETNEFEEETYPVEVKKIPAKIGEKTNVVTCFTFAAPTYETKQSSQARRHTISGFEIHDIACTLNLRNDLLRSFAQKKMSKSQSLQKIEEEQPLAEVSYNKHQSRRKSTLVTDVLTAVSSNEHGKKIEERKSSLVSDIIKFDPSSAGRRGSLAGTQEGRRSSFAGTLTGSRGSTVVSQVERLESLGEVPKGYHSNSNKPTQPQKLETVKALSKRAPKSMHDNRQVRMNEVSKLKYTSAARAAKMAFREAHVSIKANRRLSLQATDHYLTMKCVQRMCELQGNKVEKSASSLTKLKNWQKKFKMALNTDTSF